MCDSVVKNLEIYTLFADIINRLFVYKYNNKKEYEEDKYWGKELKHTPWFIAETRCTLTADTLLYIIYDNPNKLSNYVKIDTLDELVKILDLKNIIVFTMGSNYELFPGHTFVIFRLNNKYLIIESYITVKPAHYKFYTKDELIKHMKQFFDFKDIDDVTLRYDLWYKLTGVNFDYIHIPEHETFRIHIFYPDDKLDVENAIKNFTNKILKTVESVLHELKNGDKKDIVVVLGNKFDSAIKNVNKLYLELKDKINEIC